MNTYYVILNNHGEGFKMVAKDINNLRRILIGRYAVADAAIYNWSKGKLGAHVGTLHITRENAIWVHKGSFFNAGRSYVNKNGKLGEKVM